jgi:hypothetical protein
MYGKMINVYKILKQFEIRHMRNRWEDTILILSVLKWDQLLAVMNMIFWVP